MAETSDLDFDFGHPMTDDHGEFPDGWYEYDSFDVILMKDGDLVKLNPYAEANPDCFSNRNLVEVRFYCKGFRVCTKSKTRYWFVENGLELNRLYNIDTLIINYFGIV